MEKNTEITKEMLNEIYKHDYEDSSHLVNLYVKPSLNLDKLLNEKIKADFNNSWVNTEERLPKKVDGRIRTNAYYVKLTDDYSILAVAEYHFGDKRWIDINTRQIINPISWLDLEID